MASGSEAFGLPEARRQVATGCVLQPSLIVSLEEVLQGELNVTRSFRLGDDTHIRANAVVRGIQNRVVKRVDEFSPELELVLVEQGEGLGEREIDVLQARAAH